MKIVLPEQFSTLKFKILTTLLFVIGLQMQGQLLASNYLLSEAMVDALFDQSTDLTGNFTTVEWVLSPTQSSVFDEEYPSYQTAAIMAFAETAIPYAIYGGWFFFTGLTGGLGIILLPGAVLLAALISNPYHRYYLGTNDNRFAVGALYCITGNGLGLLSIVDGVMLLIAEEGHTDYIDNDNFIMWLDEVR